MDITAKGWAGRKQPSNQRLQVISDSLAGLDDFPTLSPECRLKVQKAISELGQLLARRFPDRRFRHGIIRGDVLLLGLPVR